MKSIVYSTKPAAPVNSLFSPKILSYLSLCNLLVVIYLVIILPKIANKHQKLVLHQHKLYLKNIPML